MGVQLRGVHVSSPVLARPRALVHARRQERVLTARKPAAVSNGGEPCGQPGCGKPRGRFRWCGTCDPCPGCLEPLGACGQVVTWSGCGHGTCLRCLVEYACTPNAGELRCFTCRAVATAAEHRVVAASTSALRVYLLTKCPGDQCTPHLICKPCDEPAPSGAVEVPDSELGRFRVKCLGCGQVIPIERPACRNSAEWRGLLPGGGGGDGVLSVGSE